MKEVKNMSKFNPKKLIELRINKKLSYTDLMFEIYKNDGIRISYPTLVSWEKGKTTPNCESLAAVAKYFGKPMLYFFE